MPRSVPVRFKNGQPCAPVDPRDDIDVDAIVAEHKFKLAADLRRTMLKLIQDKKTSSSQTTEKARTELHICEHRDTLFNSFNVLVSYDKTEDLRDVYNVLKLIFEDKN